MFIIVNQIFRLSFHSQNYEAIVSSVLSSQYHDGNQGDSGTVLFTTTTAAAGNFFFSLLLKPDDQHNFFIQFLCDLLSPNIGRQ
jgi:hypothetical protein